MTVHGVVDLADHQHDNHHRDNGDGQADEGNLDKRGDDIVDEGHNRDGHSVGQLSLGESIGSYIKKRRLANAAQRLLYTDDKIITIAFDNNFESAEAFSRAFKTVYKVNPSTYRRNRIHTFTSGKQRLDDEKITRRCL